MEREVYQPIIISKKKHYRGYQCECQCNNCSKIFTIIESQINQGMGRFCSRKCYGEALKEKRNPYHWQGGIIFKGNLLYEHVGYGNYYRPLHRLKLEEKLKRPLRRGEKVRHINGDQTDNRIENLEIIKKRTKEEVLAYQRRYYQKNRERILARHHDRKKKHYTCSQKYH